MTSGPLVAAAPISWGVSEVQGWGHQMTRERVLSEMSELGFEATEAGPPGYLPLEPEAQRAVLSRHGLRLAAGFLAAILHEASAGGIVQVEVEARRLAASGADVIVLAAAMPNEGYDGRQELSDGAWRTLFEALDSAGRIAADQGLTLAVHPHIGTAVQDSADVARLLDCTRANLCLDTGHLALGGVDPVALVTSAGGRIKHVHLKDVDPGVGSAFRAGKLSFGDAVRHGVFRPLGQGGVDVGGVVTGLLRAGYSGWFVLEQDTVLAAEPEPNGGPMVATRDSLAYFRRISSNKVVAR
jgi:inosose dehydratase